MANLLDDSLFAPHATSNCPLIIRPDGTEWRFREFVSLSCQLARALISSGVQPGDRVAAQVKKSPEALALYAACVKAGAVFLPLNTAYTADEVGYFLSDAEARIFVCDASTAAAMNPVAEQTGTTIETFNDNASGTLIAKALSQSTQFESVARNPDDLAAILYTSGTTGRSKGAMLSQRNLHSNALALVKLWRFDRNDVLLHALPIFHTHGLFVASNVTLLAGGSMIFFPGFNIEEILAALPKATTMMGVPTFYTRLLADQRLTRELVAHMRLFVSGSAPLLEETHGAFEARTGHRILERYGMTETGMNTSNPYDGERRAGTVGLPLPGVEARIADPESGAILADGEVGMLEVKGDNVFSGYWRMPEKTAVEFRDDGYFITGDLAARESGGYFRIVGREKDLIISGGYNVYPKEVELLIDEQDGVLESAVFGVPHRDFGEAVVAVVVPASGAILHEETLQQAIGNKIARFKQPKRLMIVTELPRNSMGKVQKNILRKTYQSLLNET